MRHHITEISSEVCSLVYSDYGCTHFIEQINTIITFLHMDNSATNVKAVTDTILC